MFDIFGDAGTLGRVALFEGFQLIRRPWVVFHGISPLFQFSDFEAPFAGVIADFLEQPGFGQWAGIFRDAELKLLSGRVPDAILFFGRQTLFLDFRQELIGDGPDDELSFCVVLPDTGEQPRFGQERRVFGNVELEAVPIGVEYAVFHAALSSVIFPSVEFHSDSPFGWSRDLYITSPGVCQGFSSTRFIS